LKPYYDEDGITIYHGDCREVVSEMSSHTLVDLVLTDPPYPQEFQPLFGFLGHLAKRLLVQGGSLVTLCGVHQLPEVLDMLRAEGLRYWWTGGMEHVYPTHYPGKWVVNRWKPALWFVQDGFSHPGSSPIDLMPPTGRDKRFHRWGQSVGWFGHWTERLTDTEGIVLDPFMGAGTTLIAAREVGRKAIGIEIEEEHCEIAVQRLAQGVLDFEPLETP
jgi:site-specific DNA-methyltransferase (adenine-specific)